MDKPLVSVVMPVYNTAAYVKSAVESILSQDYQNFEFVIVDDGSTDDTANILAPYSSDPRIKLIKNETNKGYSFSRNRGIEATRGKYIVWQDSDDISYPNRLTTLVDFMEKNPSVGICGSAMCVFDNTGKEYIRSYPISDVDLRKLIFRQNPVAQPSAIVRREALDKVGGYDTSVKITEDLDILFRIGMYYRFANCIVPLYKYRIHQNSSTFSKNKLMELTGIKLRIKYFSNSNYSASLIDACFLSIQLVTLYLIPARIRLSLFELIRRNLNA